jgi:hypothetical protein
MSYGKKLKVLEFVAEALKIAIEKHPDNYYMQNAAKALDELRNEMIIEFKAVQLGNMTSDELLRLKNNQSVKA